MSDELRRVLTRLVAAGHLVATELDTLELLAYGACLLYTSDAADE